MAHLLQALLALVMALNVVRNVGYHPVGDSCVENVCSCPGGGTGARGQMSQSRATCGASMYFTLYIKQRSYRMWNAQTSP